MRFLSKEAIWERDVCRFEHYKRLYSFTTSSSFREYLIRQMKKLQAEYSHHSFGDMPEEELG